MSKATLRDQILLSDDMEYEEVEVPQWGVTVLVSSLSASERAKLMWRARDRDTGDINIEELYALLFVHTVRDPEDQGLLFTEKDIPKLNEKNGAALEVVCGVAARLAGLDQEDEKSLGKPSSQDTTDSTQSEDSPTT